MIDALVARLDDDKAALGLRLVGGAAEFQAAADGNPPAFPAAYVVLLNEAPGEGSVSGLVIQRVGVTVGLCLAVRNVADAKGGAASQDMQALRAAIKASLLGWAPQEGCDPLERGPGQLLAFRPGGVMWWQDIYTSSYFDRSEL